MGNPTARIVSVALLLAGCAKPPVLGAVNFNTGTTTITNPSDERHVDQAAAFLAEKEKWSVIVLGLADTEGDAKLNLDLSIQRAEAIAAMLKDKAAIDDSRIVVHGFGEKLAVGTSLQERKVEFVFFKDKDQPIRDVVIASGVLSRDIRRKKMANKKK